MKAFEEIPKEEYNKIAFVSDELLEDLLGVKVLGVKNIWYEQNIDNKWKKKEHSKRILISILTIFLLVV